MVVLYYIKIKSSICQNKNSSSPAKQPLCPRISPPSVVPPQARAKTKLEDGNNNLERAGSRESRTMSLSHLSEHHNVPSEG